MAKIFGYNYWDDGKYSWQDYHRISFAYGGDFKLPRLWYDRTAKAQWNGNEPKTMNGQFCSKFHSDIFTNKIRVSLKEYLQARFCRRCQGIGKSIIAGLP